MVREVDPQNVWVSDIYADAVAFQKLTFGVNGFVSVTNPDELEGETGFHMIFVASLFTHLPGPRFEAWLRRLFSMLSPEGILAFSVHDEALAAGKNIPESGILFSPESESQSLGKAEYVTNIVTEAYVSGAIRKAAGPRWKYHRGRSVLCGAHDVYVISRDGEETFSNFNYQLRPIGYLDGFLKDDDGSIRLFGWAGEPTSGIELEEVRVYIDNELVAATKTTQPRPDVVLALGQPKFSHSGWEIRLSSTHGYKDIAMVEVIAASQNGGSTVLHFSPIGVALKSSRAT